MFNQNPQGNSNGMEAQADPTKLFIGNVSWNVTEEDLREAFSEHGEVVECNLITERHSGRSKGIAFIKFSTEEEAQAAIDAKNGFELDGRALIVNVARPRQPRDDRRGGYNRDRR